MAYRRKHSVTRTSTFEDHRSAGPDEQPSSPSSLAAQAIRASSAHRDSSLSSAYGESAFSSAYREPNPQRPSHNPQDPTTYEYTSMRSLNESKYGFWGVLARKAKSILEDDNVARQFEENGRNKSQILDTTGGQFHQSHLSHDSRKTDNPSFHKGSDAIASSLNYIGGTIKNALEEGLTIVENRTADIIQETRKLQIRRKSGGSGAQNQATDILEAPNLSQSQTDQETQLKASRDVANAMAAKAKLLLRELKTVKADLTFAKERCAQLEEQNKILRESRQKGDNSEDDDLIRLQLETLLAEKGRLAHENSVYARENRFLREIVEYHQLTMQDVVYLDEGSEEVTEVCPLQIPNYPFPHSAPELPSPVPLSPSTPTPTKPTTPPSPNTALQLEARPAIPAPPPSPPLHSPLVVVTETASSSPSLSPTSDSARRRQEQHSPTPP